MPIYEYQCDKCGHEMEAIQRLSEDPLKQCPACEQDTLVKLISAAGFRLKGTGWYETDFKNKPSADKSSDSSGKADGTAKDGKSNSTSDTGAKSAETTKTPAAKKET